jgi:Flp/Fap pilin component
MNAGRVADSTENWVGRGRLVEFRLQILWRGEYGLIAAGIALVIIAAVQLVGTNLTGIFNTVANASRCDIFGLRRRAYPFMIFLTIEKGVAAIGLLRVMGEGASER